MHGEAVKFEPGDYVKFEVRDNETGESEWMWLRIEDCDEEKKVILGTLDSQPVVFTATLKLGQHLAVSYDNVREYRKNIEF